MISAEELIDSPRMKALGRRSKNEIEAKRVLQDISNCNRRDGRAKDAAVARDDCAPDSGAPSSPHAPSPASASSPAQNREGEGARSIILARNKDIINIYRRSGGRQSLEPADSPSSAAARNHFLEDRVRSLEHQLSTAKESLGKSEMLVEELEDSLNHFQSMAQAASAVLCKESQADKQDRETAYGTRIENKLRQQNERLEALVDELCRHVDTETTIQRERTTMQAFRKSLELMSTLQELEEEDGRLAEKQTWNDIELVIRLKSDLERSQQAEKQLTAENEELSRLTSEMQAAHARLLAGVQTLQKQQQGGAAGAQDEALACEKEKLMQQLDDVKKEIAMLRERHAARIEEVRKQALSVGSQRCEEMERLHAEEHGVLMRRVSFLQEELEASRRKVKDLMDAAEQVEMRGGGAGPGAKRSRPSINHGEGIQQDSLALVPAGLVPTGVAVVPKVSLWKVSLVAVPTTFIFFVLLLAFFMAWVVNSKPSRAALVF